MFSKIKLLLASIIIFHGHIYTSEQSRCNMFAIGSYPEGEDLILRIELKEGTSWEKTCEDILKQARNVSTKYDTENVSVLKRVDVGVRDVYGIGRKLTDFELKRPDHDTPPYIRLLKSRGNITAREIDSIKEAVYQWEYNELKAHGEDPMDTNTRVPVALHTDWLVINKSMLGLK